MCANNHTDEDCVRDDRFRTLLRQWQDVEPQAGFEAAVWRRVQAGVPKHAEGGWRNLWDWMLPHPILAGAAAMALAFLVGAAAALVVPASAVEGSVGHHALLRPGTVSGTYLALAERRQR